MRLAIADPPYLGRAALWYGGKGRTAGRGGRACGRGPDAPEFHEDAAVWDDPEQHKTLMTELSIHWDGWAMAASAKTLGELLPHADDLGARLAIWHVTNAIPDGSRVKSAWEAILYWTPRSRRAGGAGMRTKNVLIAAHPKRGFVGAKPDAWVTWVLDLLGYQADTDEVTDIFPGSGSVTRVIEGRLL